MGAGIDGQRREGLWAAWGWVGPAYTLSLRSMWRPSGPFGSMPLTARRKVSSGCLASSSL